MRQQVLAFDRQQHALHTHRKADTRCCRAADLFDQSVITAAAANSALRSQRSVLDLKGGLSIVIKSAHQIMVDYIIDAGSSQKLLQTFKMRFTFFAQTLFQTGRACRQLLIVRIFAVQQTQRITVKTRLTILTHFAKMRAEILLQLFSVQRPAFRAANGIDFQL